MMAMGDMELPENPSDRDITEANRRTEFVRDAMPDNWLSYSEELENAAEVLWSHVGDVMTIEGESGIDGSIDLKKSSHHARTYVLLAGLALENALKAIIVTQNPALISSGVLHQSLKNHSLTRLAELIGDLQLTKVERRVLQICQDAIPYWGRYPVPLRFAGLKPAEAVTGDFRDTFRALHFRLCKRTYEAIKEGWDSGAGAKIRKVHSARYGDRIDTQEPFFPDEVNRGQKEG